MLHKSTPIPLHARINITIDIEDGGVRKKTELPLNILVLGSFGLRLSGSLAKLNKINVNKDNFNQVLSSLQPEFNALVANKIKKDNSYLGVNLKFATLSDFRPENIARQVPELKRLLAMRNLLKDLRANINDNSQLRKELKRLCQDRHNLMLLQKRGK